MKRTIKLFGLLALVVCVCMVFSSCNTILDLLTSGNPGTNREPCDFADSVWKTDDGSLTIYGTGNGETATGVYSHDGETVELFLHFDDFGNVDVYDYAATYNDEFESGRMEIWDIDFINFDYHGFLELERAEYTVENPAFDPLFSDKKPVKLSRIQKETVPEKEIVESNDNYRIFKNDLSLYGYKLLGRDGKTVLSGFSKDVPEISKADEQIYHIEFADFDAHANFFYNIETNQVSNRLIYNPKLSDYKDGMVAYINKNGDDEETRIVTIWNVFPQNSFTGYGGDCNLDFLQKGDVIQKIELDPEKTQVKVTYKTFDDHKVKVKAVSYKESAEEFAYCD